MRKAGRELPVRIFWGPGVGNPTPAEMEVQGYHAPQAVYLRAVGGGARAARRRSGPRRRSPRALGGGREHALRGAVGAAPSRDRGAARGRPPAGARTASRSWASRPRCPSAAETTALLYVGPKDHALLSSSATTWPQVVPVGEWIGPIVVPLMGLLRWVHGHVGNYGWSIVLLTVLINLVMAPLRHYSIANGMKMAKLAPEMKVIQDRYRKVPALDPRRQEMQKEIAALYARHGMSMSTQMLVGCLPLLLTMPFLIAFYRVLSGRDRAAGRRLPLDPRPRQKDPSSSPPSSWGCRCSSCRR